MSLKQKSGSYENNRTLSLKALGELFGCGKTQIGKILKNKDGILDHMRPMLQQGGCTLSLAPLSMQR